jgi:hypothetical protein
MKEKGILGNLIGDANVNVFFDLPSAIKLGLVAITSGMFLVIFSKLINRFFK